MNSFKTSKKKNSEGEPEKAFKTHTLQNNHWIGHSSDMCVLSNPRNKGMPKKNWSLMGTEWTVYGLRGTTQVGTIDVRQITRELVCKAKEIALYPACSADLWVGLN